MKSGKWYFEFEAVTTGEMRVGWARPNVRPDVELGADDLAYVFNGHRVSLGCILLFILGQPLSSSYSVSLKPLFICLGPAGSALAHRE